MDPVTATQSFYGRWARLYDVIATAPGVASWRRRAADSLDIDPGDTVVEMGCGTGANLPFLRERVGPDGTVVGIDVTRELLSRARERVEREGWTNVSVVQADATQPPIEGPVDAVLGTFVVGMFPDPAEAVADWCDLCPGGRVALLNFQPSDRLLARPLNLAFEGFVWISAPGWSLPEERPVAPFQRRVSAARTALADRTVDRIYREFAGGYLGLVAGRVPKRSPSGE
ncbi:class I SAM-dependent methyltransferase [Halorientalis salina]|uniref:class I SAM-dependent methyltransferase n=1 Tax=Halorientalis salina TaxID=2932266 RepID=UPI0010ABF5C2|nr:methyltransferase domain-containing protein [Halorientalis salina]